MMTSGKMSAAQVLGRGRLRAALLGSPGTTAAETAAVKDEGKDNNLIELIKGDAAFRMSEEEIDSIMDPKNFIGMANIQVEDFISQAVAPIIQKYEGRLDAKGEVNV